MPEASTRDAYTCNTTVEKVAARLRAGERFALLTHSKPDGDAVGSTVALARVLAKIGKKAWPVFIPPWSERFDDIVDDTEVIHESHGVWHKPPLHKIDTIVLCDTGSWSQVADAHKWIEGRSLDTIIIDHHKGGDADIGDMRLIDTSASATCELIADLAVILLGKRSHAELPAELAVPLFEGIATDTGWFRHSNTTPRTHRLAADLIEAGADSASLFALNYQQDEPSRLKLLQRALASMQILAGGKAAMLTLRKSDFAETGASNDETGGFTDILQAVKSFRVVALVTELDEKTTKVSMRSKSGGWIVDVNELAGRLGGGGHVHAAGAKLAKPVDEAAPEIAALLDGAAR